MDRFHIQQRVEHHSGSVSWVSVPEGSFRALPEARSRYDRLTRVEGRDPNQLRLWDMMEDRETF